MITDRMSPMTYKALVGPTGTPTSEHADLPAARTAVIRALSWAADVSPPDARVIDEVLTRLRAADGEFVDYFEVDGLAWTAQFWPVEEKE